MALIDHFGPPKKRPGQPDFVQMRRVPIQPPETPLDRVWLGSELGFLQYSGDRPRPSDVVTIVGQSPNQIVIAVGSPPQRDPLFVEQGCKCKCANGGLIFYLTPVIFTTNLIVIDGITGDIVYRSLLPEVLNGQGIAVDPIAPYNLYILDNRSTYQNLLTDTQPQPFLASKNYFTLVTYTLSGNSYSFSRADVLPGGTNNGSPGDQPPWNIYATALSVINGTVWISRTGQPARFFKWDGSAFTTVTLMQNDATVADQVLGPVIQVADKPVPKTSLFVATQGNQILRFNEAGIVSESLVVTGATRISGLVTSCNRIIAMETLDTGRTEDQGTLPLGGGGGGEEG